MSEEKSLEDLTPEEIKELKIVFAPGSFDNFDGTQEELDALIAEITQMVKDGTLLEKSRPVDIDELIEDDPELAEAILKSMDTEPRNLQ